jgi:hypothetical protein
MGLSSGINPSASVVLKNYVPSDWLQGRKPLQCTDKTGI